MEKQEYLLSIVSEMVEASLENCAARNHNNNTKLVVEDLRQGRNDGWISFTNSLGS